MNGCYQTYNPKPFCKGTAKIKRQSFQGPNFISSETIRRMFT